MWQAKERMQLKTRQKRHAIGPRRKRTEYGICLAKNEHLL